MADVIISRFGFISSFLLGLELQPRCCTLCYNQHHRNHNKSAGMIFTFEFILADSMISARTEKSLLQIRINTLQDSLQQQKVLMERWKKRAYCQTSRLAETEAQLGEVQSRTQVKSSHKGKSNYRRTLLYFVDSCRLCNRE
jgi:hypothetical protein